MRNALNICFFSLLFLFVLTSFCAAGTINLRDENVSVGYPFQLDCVGAGITCTKSGGRGIITVATTAGGAGATTSSGGVTYVTTTTDDFAVGSTTSSGADLFVDVGTGVVTVEGTLNAASITTSGSGITTFNNAKNATNDVQVHGDTIDAIMYADVSANKITMLGTFIPRAGATAPSNCVNDALWIDSNATSGQRIYVCESGVWVQQGGAGSGDVTGVGDCASGACLDGTSDGGTYIRIYDGDSNYAQIDVQGALASDITLDLPTSSGTLKLSQDIGARAYGGTQTLANLTPTAINFSTEDYDTDDIFTAATSVFTIQTAGKYLMTGGVRYTTGTSGSRGLSIEVNGTSVARDFRAAATGTSTYSINVSTIYDCAVNDVIKLMGYQGSGGNLGTLSLGESTPHLSIQKLD